MRSRLGALVAALVVVFGLGLSSQAPAAVPDPCDGRSVAGSHTDGGLLEYTLESDRVDDPSFRVYRPTSFTEGGDLLLLLHGAGDDHTTWSTKSEVDLSTIVDGRNILIVMPTTQHRDGSQGWYTDAISRDRAAWETHHLAEVVPFVEACFDAGGDRDSRIVAGLSMGGYGAMKYAARHPEMFGAAGSFSGAVDNRAGGAAQAEAYNWASCCAGMPSEDVWGPYDTHETNWAGHNPPDLAVNLRRTGLYLATGNGVPLAPQDSPAGSPLEAGVYLLNEKFDRRLGDLAIAHTYEPRLYGTHEWHYWAADLDRFLDWLDEADRIPDRPAAFTHRSADDAFSAWDWSFSVSGRAEQAFTDLTGVSSTGLRAAGTGTLSVTTAPVDPGTYLVNGVEVPTDDGRLAFDVDLTPGGTTVRIEPAA